MAARPGDPSGQAHRGAWLASVLGLLLVLGLCYRPGLGGGFVFDDGPNLLANDALHLDDVSLQELVEAALSGNAGPLRRPLSMVSFALNRLYGDDPLAFKLVNLAIHALNALLVLRLAWLLLELARRAGRLALTPVATRWLALAAAALWALHPIQLTSVLYVVQRMTSLSATFVLAALIAYLLARRRQLAGRPGGHWLVASALCTALATLAKESGALAPVYALAIEAVWLRFRDSTDRACRPVVAWHLLLVGLPLVAAAAFLGTHPEWLSARYAARPFTLPERVLTEAVVLWAYLRQVLLPDVGRLGLYHAEVTAPVWQGVIAALGWAAALAAAWWARARHPLPVFALAWFLGGHLMESTVLPLELVHEHRNYLPSVGPLLAAVVGWWLLPAASVGPALRKTTVAALVTVFALATAGRAGLWSNPLLLAAMQVQHHPGSGRAHYEFGRVLYLLHGLEHDPLLLERARSEFETAARLEPWRQKPLFALLLVDAGEGRGSDTRLLARLEERLRTQPFQSGDIVDLKVLVECQARRRCRLGQADFRRLFGALRDNPTLHPQLRSVVLSLEGFYHGRVRGDLAAAEASFRAAVAAAPRDVRTRLNLVDALIARGDLDAAQQELAVARRLDWLDAHRSLLERYAGLLAARWQTTAGA